MKSPRAARRLVALVLATVLLTVLAAGTAFAGEPKTIMPVKPDLPNAEVSMQLRPDSGNQLIAMTADPSQAANGWNGMRVLFCYDAQSCSNQSDPGNVQGVDRAVEPSMQLAKGWQPRIAYRNPATNDLELALCETTSCNVADHVVVDGYDEYRTGFEPSLALTDEDLPVIAYYDEFGGGNLNLAYCEDPDCDDITVTTVDYTSADAGHSPSLALTSDNKPVIAYYDATYQNLKLVACNDVRCWGGDENFTAVDTWKDVGQNPSLALDENDNPAISFFADYGPGQRNLRLVRCLDTACDGPKYKTTVDGSSADVGRESSLVLDDDGNTVIAYTDETNHSIKTVRCASAHCTGGGNNYSYIAGNAGLSVDLDLAKSWEEQVPAIAFTSLGSGPAMFARCFDVNCDF